MSMLSKNMLGKAALRRRRRRKVVGSGIGGVRHLESKLVFYELFPLFNRVMDSLGELLQNKKTVKSANLNML